jgi:hypothetical protein
MNPISRQLTFVLLFACGAAPSAIADDWRPLKCDPSAALGAWSCAATACHGGSELSRRTSGGELERWRNADPHARSSTTIESDAFARILLRLGIITKIGAAKGPGQRFEDLAPNKDNAEDRTTAVAQVNECLKCHNPMGAPTSWTRDASRPEHLEESMSDGLAIGCETCHGPAKTWIGNHFRRDFDREQDCFHDLKNPLIRARTCAQCHIGDGERDMNHDMIAAGHPPLRFDLAAYERALPKHWNDARQRAGTKDYELKLWLAGQLANFDSGLQLFESRLERAETAPDNRTKAPFPEFAESNCSACHHGLKAATQERESGLAFEPRSQPLANKGWNCGALMTLAGPERHANAADLPAALDRFRDLVAERYRPLLAPEAAVPANLLTEFQLAPNYDQQLQGYALYLAAAKSRYDEQLKLTGAAARPAVLEELTALRVMLTPRARTGSNPTQRLEYREAKALFEAAAKALITE